MNNVCPARLEPVFHQRPWGALSLAPLFPEKAHLPEPIGEAWMTSAECRFANGPYSGKTLGESWREMPPEWKGTQFASGAGFPLLVKFIFAEEKLSVQVHPDDEYASRNESAAGGKGKTEMWHVLRAAPGAEVLAGLRPSVTRESFQAAIAEGTAENCLARVPVSAGDTIFIPAGTPHTIGAGLTLCEIQQYSDLTYRIYDYNRRDKQGKARELHVEKALDVIRFERQRGGKIHPAHLPRGPLAEAHFLACCYFAAEKWDFAVRVPRAASREHFDLLIFLEGGGHIGWAAQQAEYARAEAWLLPAALGDYCLAPASKTSVIRAYVPGDLGEVARRLASHGLDESACARLVIR